MAHGLATFSMRVFTLYLSLLIHHLLVSFASGGFSVVPRFDGATVALVLVALIIVLFNHIPIIVSYSAEESGPSDVAVEKVFDEIAAEGLSGHNRHDNKSASWFNRIGKVVLSAFKLALGFSAQLATHLLHHHMPSIWALFGTTASYRVDLDGILSKTNLLNIFRPLGIHRLPPLRATFFSFFHLGAKPFFTVFTRNTRLLHAGGLTASLVNGMAWFSAKVFVIVAGLGDIRERSDKVEGIRTHHDIGGVSMENERDMAVDQDMEGTTTDSDESSSVHGSFFSSDSNASSIGTSITSPSPSPLSTPPSTPPSTPTPATPSVSSSDKLESKNAGHLRGIAKKGSTINERPPWNSSLRKLDYDPLEDRFLKSLARAKRVSSSPSGKTRTPGLSTSARKSSADGKLVAGAL